VKVASTSKCGVLFIEREREKGRDREERKREKERDVY
jgi:hypothetical protein